MSRSRPRPTTGWPPTGDPAVLVYDLGGGTFDTTVLQIADGDGHRCWPPMATISWAALMSISACSRPGARTARSTSFPGRSLTTFAEDGRQVSNLALDVEAAKKAEQRGRHAMSSSSTVPARAGHGHRQPGRSGGGLRRSLRHHRRDHRAGPRLGPGRRVPERSMT